MERQFIEHLLAAQVAHPQVERGIGDDAAVVRILGERCVAAVDTITEDVDFILAEADPRQIGRKALAINLSDMAAMAAQPVAALVSLLLPKNADAELAPQIHAGILELATVFHTAIAGGDTGSWNGKLVVSVTILGQAPPAGLLLRSGAEVGQAVLATGSFGGSILGKHFTFTPRVVEALVLRRDYGATAAIDVSDGLLLDAFRLASESGVGVALDLDAVPISEAAVTLARQSGRSPLDHALADGEDFEIVFTMPPDQADRLLADPPFATPVTRIGQVVESPGLWRNEGSTLTPLEPRGYEHTW